MVEVQGTQNAPVGRTPGGTKTCPPGFRFVGGKCVPDNRPKKEGGGDTFTQGGTDRPSGITKRGKTFLGNISPEDVQRAQGQVGGQGQGPQQGRPGEFELQTQIKPQLEQAGAFETNVPFRPDLTLDSQSGASSTALGQAGGFSSQSILGIAQKLGKLGPVEQDFAEAFPQPLDELSLREEALLKIRRKSFTRGLSRAEKFGSMVEAIPIIGGEIGKYVGDLIQDPSSNADFVIKQINVIKEDASTGQEKVRNGLEAPDFGLEQARQMEEDLAELVGRLKLLANSSAVLQANTDQLHAMEQNILAAKKKVARYKEASALGFTADLTGTGRAIPTNEQILNELRGQ